MVEYNAVVDSGIRQEFDTGARRDTRSGKGRFDLIPVEPLFRLAKHLENGAVKYGDNNWRKGIPSSRFYDSAMRHLCAYMRAENAGFANEQRNAEADAALEAYREFTDMLHEAAKIQTYKRVLVVEPKRLVAIGDRDGVTAYDVALIK